MKEIKFRAWDTKKKSFDYEPLICRGKSCFIDSFDNFEEYEEGRMVLQQYTGLKDSNDKEIYEGDIVTARLASMKGGFTGYVHYLNAQYWVNYIGYESYYQSLIYLHGAEYEPIKVIGNIYENPWRQPHDNTQTKLSKS